jgi:PTH1 family peptidyl-tRNA hydrolase
MALKLLIGLGNPGEKYLKTRHNIGFMFIDYMADGLSLAKPVKEAKLKAKIAKNSELIIAKPLTYMNDSGDAVLKISNYYKIAVEDILIIHDDVSLATGSFKFSFNRGAGGQHGIEDSIRKLNSKAFYRLRLGVGPDPGGDQRASYVLSNFPKAEQSETLPELFRETAKLVEIWLKDPSLIQNPSKPKPKKNKVDKEQADLEKAKSISDLKHTQL